MCAIKQKGNFEKETFFDGTTTTNREINYIFAPDGLIAIYENKNGTGKMFYTATDNLGSVNMIVDGSTGQIVDDLSYDVWGRFRNPNDWTYNNISLSSITDRGYTGHEHMTAFSLINMNGRVYDPYTSQFLSPDPFIQDPANPQNYNRYSYVLNNPLKFTDQSGYNYMIDGMEVSERAFFRFIENLSGNIESIGLYATSIFSTDLLINTLSGDFSYFDNQSSNQNPYTEKRNKDKKAGKKQYKLKLVKNSEIVDDLMHARFRDGKFVGWVSDLYLQNLLNKGEWGEVLHNSIEDELSFRPEFNLPSSFGSYEEIVQFFANEHSITTSMKAPTVERITGNTTLTYNFLPSAMRFDVEKGRRNWSIFGPDSDFINFRFTRNNILKTSFSRVQPQYGILNTIPRSDFTEINGRFYYVGAIATRFNYSVSVPVIR